MAWVWQAENHRYVNGKRILTERELLDLRNAIADGMTEESASLAAQLVGKVLSLAEWAKAFARLIANGVTAGFLLGRGGKAQMDDKALLTLGSLIADQHDYAKDFTKAIAAELENEEPQLGFVAGRSALYSGAAVHAFDQGRAQDFMVDLPYYPADLGTVCGNNCRCEWQIVDTDTELTATWIVVGDERSCDDCIARGKEFGPDSPFVQKKAKP